MRFRSPLLSQSRLFSLPPGTEMVHFPGFARTRLWIHRAVAGFYPAGFPHSEIPGSKPVCGSPRLIAACHVLHRLRLPRHPPCALSSLTTKFTRRRSCWPLAIGRLPPLLRQSKSYGPFNALLLASSALGFRGKAASPSQSFRASSALTIAHPNPYRPSSFLTADFSGC